MNKSIGDRVRLKRTGLRLSQGELAKRVGVSQTLISKLEKYPNRTTKHIVRLAEALECSPQWLEFGDENEPTVTRSPPPTNKEHKHEVNDQAMVPQFAPGNIVYYKNSKPLPGDFVVVEIDGHVTVRKYRVVNIEDQEEAYLVPENEDFPKTKADKAKLLGVVTQHVIFFGA